MSKQLLRCGTSIGANVREGLYAQSRKDFISKLNIALKEAGETDYWLDVIHSAEYFTDDEYQSLKEDNDELLKLLTSIIKLLISLYRYQAYHCNRYHSSAAIGTARIAV